MNDTHKVVRKVINIVMTAMTVLWSVGAATFAPLTVRAATPGQLIKMAGNSSVYYLHTDMKRYVWPNENTYKSWYPDFSQVVTVSQSELQSYTIGARPVMRAGTYLGKVTTDPKVYAVEPGGALRWVQTESIAKALYGDNWASKVVDIPDAFFSDYTIGSPISSNLYPSGTLVKSASSSDIWYVDGSSKRKVSAAGISGNMFNTAYVVTGQDSILAALSMGSEVTSKESSLSSVVSGAGVIVTPGGSGLTVALASDTPASGVVADLTAFNPTLKFNLTASSDGAVNVTAMTFTRLGISQDSDIAGIGVYTADGVRHGNFVTFANTKANVAFNSSPIMVPAGQTIPVWVKVNLANVAAASGTYALSLAAATDVTTTANVTGSFPVMGNGFSIIDGSSSVGSVSVDAVQVFSNGVNDATAVNINLGTIDQTVGRFRLVAGSQEDIKVTKVTLYNSGNANDGDVVNIKLVGPDGTVLSTITQTANRVATFDLSANPYVITKGNTRDLSVRMDVVSGSTRTVRFVVQNDYDIEASGVATGSGLLPTAAAAVDTSFPIGDSSGAAASCTTGVTCINKITINSGTLLYAKASDAPNGNVAAGGSNIVLGKWEATAQGEDMELRQVQYTVNATTNLSGTLQIKVNGASVYSVTATSADTTLTTRTLSSYPVIKAGVKAIITIETGISSTATNGATLQAALDITQVKRVSTNDIVDPTVTSTSGNTLTISTASLAVASNASYPNTTIVSGLSEAKVGSFNFTASSTEDVSVASITIGLTNTTNVSNLMIKDGTTQLGSTTTTPSSSNVISLTGVNIVKGTTKTVDVYLTTNGSTTGTEVTSITAVSATGSSSSATVTATGLTATGQTITFATAGTLTLTNDSTNTPVKLILHSSEVDVPLLAVRVTSNNAEAVKITAVQVTAQNGNTSLQNLKLYNGAMQVGSTVQLTNGVALFSDFSTNGLLTVAKDTTLTLTVKGSTTASSAINSQATSALSLDYVQALGASGGATIKPGTTLNTSWTATNITAAGASLTVGSTAGFHKGDVVFAYDGTNGGTLGVVTTEPTSTTTLAVAGLSALTFAGSATISKIETGATTAASAGASGVATANVQYTVTTTKGFSVNDSVMINGATTSQLGIVISVDSGVLITIRALSATSTGTAANISKIGTDTLGTTGATISAAAAPTATTVASTTGFSVGDMVLFSDIAGGNAGTFCQVTAIGSTTSMTLSCNAAVTGTAGTQLITRVGSANPATALVSTAASAGNRVIAATATTVTDTTGFGAADVTLGHAATGGAILGKVGAVSSTTSLTIASAAASATTTLRLTRLPGASSSGNLITLHDVEPKITANSSLTGGAATGTTGQVVGMYDVKADGDRNMDITTVNVQANGSNLPWNYVTAYDLYNGSTLLSSASPLNSALTFSTSANVLTGTSIELCTADVTAAGEIRLASAAAVTAAAALISINDTIVLFQSTSNYITAKVTNKVVGSSCSVGGAATDVTLTVSNSSTTGTAPLGTTVTALKSFNVYFGSTATTPLATQTITAGSTLTLTVKADTTSVRTGLSAGTTASFNTKINGDQGASNGGLTWGYTPSGGSAISSLTLSDSYPVNGPTFTY